MGYLYRLKLKGGRRSDMWWAKYYVNGRPVRESTGVKADTETPPAEARRFMRDASPPGSRFCPAPTGSATKTSPQNCGSTTRRPGRGISPSTIAAWST